MSRSPLLLTLSLALCAAAPLAATPVVPVSYTITGSPWAYVDDTGKQLTDGLYNSIIPGVSLGVDAAPYPYPTYNWVGWHGNTPSIDFDFGSSVTIESVTVSFGLWTAAGVYLPASTSFNGTNFAVAADGYTGFTNYDHVVLTFSGNWTGQNLTLDFTRANSAWLFMDEVTFQQGTPTAPTGSVPESGATPLYLALGLGALGFARRMMPKTSKR